MIKVGDKVKVKDKYYLLNSINTFGFGPNNIIFTCDEDINRCISFEDIYNYADTIATVTKIFDDYTFLLDIDKCGKKWYSWMVDIITDEPQKAALIDISEHCKLHVGNTVKIKMLDQNSEKTLFYGYTAKIVKINDDNTFKLDIDDSKYNWYRNELKYIEDNKIDKKIDMDDINLKHVLNILEKLIKDRKNKISLWNADWINETENFCIELERDVWIPKSLKHSASLFSFPSFDMCLDFYREHEKEFNEIKILFK